MGSGHGITGMFQQIANARNSYKEKTKQFSLMDFDKATVNITKFNNEYKEFGKVSEEFNERITNEGLKSYFKTVKDGSATFEGYKAHVKSANAANKAMSVSSRLASVGVKVLNVTLNAMVSMGIGLALNFILEGISNLANASKEAAENAKEAAEELNESISSLDSYKQKIAEPKNSYFAHTFTMYIYSYCT